MKQAWAVAAATAAARPALRSLPISTGAVPRKRGRVATRVYFRRAGDGDVRCRTVARRFQICAA